MKKIGAVLIALGVLIFVVGIAAHYILKGYEMTKVPTIQLSNEVVLVAYMDDFSYMDYVTEAEDTDGKNLKSEQYISITKEQTNGSEYTVEYTVEDEMGRKNSASLQLIVDERKANGEVTYMTPAGEIQQGQNPDAEVKKEKVFYIADYDGVSLLARSDADEYGRTSSQSYEIQPEFDENNELIGFRCKFHNE